MDLELWGGTEAEKVRTIGRDAIDGTTWHTTSPNSHPYLLQINPSIPRGAHRGPLYGLKWNGMVCVVKSVCR